MMRIRFITAEGGIGCITVDKSEDSDEMEENVIDALAVVRALGGTDCVLVDGLGELQ